MDFDCLSNLYESWDIDIKICLYSLYSLKCIRHHYLRGLKRLRTNFHISSFFNLLFLRYILKCFKILIIFSLLLMVR